METQRIVAAFPDPDEAIGAVRELRGHGIRATIDSLTRVMGAEGEMDEEARNLAPAGMGLGPPEMTRGLVKGAAAGALVGAVIGFLAGILWPTTSMSDRPGHALVAGLIAAVAGGVAGFVLGGGFGAVEAAGGTDMDGTRSAPLISERDVLVQVAPATSTQLREAEHVLQRHHPERIELVGPDGHPTARG